MGNTELEILNTLKKIERTLSQSSNTASGGNNGSRARIAGDAKSSDKGEGGKTYRATAAALEGVTGSSNALIKSFKQLDDTVKRTRASMSDMGKQMRSTGSNKRERVNIRQATASPRVTDKGDDGRITKITKSLSNTNTVLGKTIAGIALIGPEIKDILVQVAKDIFHGAARGIDTSSVLGLYDDAIRAGMGLQAYTKMLSESMPAVSRHGSFEAFSQTLDSSRERLAGLGVFGESATQLASTMVTSATVLGVSQAQMDQAAAAQTSVFEQLRKSTMMTASEFSALSAELGSTQEVQSEMLGLNQQERVGRMQQLMSIRTLGEQMGATKAASKALGDALIQQRNLTASQRFQSAGTIRQAAAVTGVSSGEAETLARLARKKTLTEDEAKLATQLGSKMQASLESMMNSGNIQQEFIAEQLQERLNSAGIGKFLGAAGNVGLTSESGDIANKDLGKGASELVKGAGLLLTYANGLSQSPLLPVVSILGTIAALLMSGKFLKSIGTKILETKSSKKITEVTPKNNNGSKGLFSILRGDKLSTVDADKSNVPSGKIGKTGKVGGKVGKVLNSITGIGSILGSMIEAFESKSNETETVKKPSVNETGDVGKVTPTATPKETPTATPVATPKETPVATPKVETGEKVHKAESAPKSTPKPTVKATPAMGDKTGLIGNVLSEAFGKVLKSTASGLKSIPGLGTIAGVIIGGIAEAVTGEVKSVFDPSGEGGIFSTIGNSIFAGFNGIFGGITGMIDSAVSSITGMELGLENAWERLFVSMRAGVMGGIASLIESMPFGEDSDLGKFFRSAADEANKVLETLNTDQSTTIASIAAGNKKTVADAKATAVEVNRATASIASGTANLTQSVIQDAKRMAIPAPAAKSSIATPSETEQKTVNNSNNGSSTQTTNTNTNTATETKTTKSEVNTTDSAQMVGLLQRLVALIEQGVKLDEIQTGALESLVSGVRRGARPDMVEMVDRMARQA